MKKIRGYIILATLCIITANIWLLAKQDLSVIISQPLRSISQIISLLGIVLLSCTLVLSTRIRFIERIFGGLDSVYAIHHIIGSIAFILILNHPLLLAIQALPHVSLTLSYLLPSSSIPYSLGVLGVYCMIVPFIFMMFITLPYHIWKFTHKILGVAFLLGSIHALLITSDISSFLPLRLWIGIWIGIGNVAVLYSLILYKVFRPRYQYEVDHIERSVDVITIFLRTENKRLHFVPGQFIYVVFHNKDVGKESHPFSIASAPDDELIKISVKIVGDYTLRLPLLQIADKVTVYGPYGEFARSLSSTKHALWVAGGIGVTPFLSMLASHVYNPPDGSTVYFYYAYRQKDEGILFVQQIKQLVAKLPFITFFEWCTQEKKRLSAQVIGEEIDVSVLDAIYLCGPISMMVGLKKQFVSSGVPESKILFENFSFLS